MLRVLICLLTVRLLTTAVATAGSAPTNAADQLIQSERQQQFLRANTEKITDQLQALIAEYQRNGLSGTEVQTLQSIAGILTQLTDQEMQRVVELLQAARRAPDAGQTQRQVVEAYASQKSIPVQLRQLIAAHQHRQELQEIAARFQALADRQGGNLNLAVIAAGPDNAMLQRDEAQRAALSAQASEQAALGAEVRIAVGQLETFAKHPANPETAGRVSKTIATIKSGKLLPVLDAAVAGLKEGQLFNAAGQEKNIRDQLRSLAQMLTRPPDPAERLKQAGADLETASRDERKVADDVHALRSGDPNRASVADRQAQLVDRVDSIRQITENLAPTAAAQIKNALDDMQRARAELRPQDTLQAERAARAAADKLADAQQSLAAELATAEKNTVAPAAAADQLRQADQELNKLISDQEKLKQNTAATATNASATLPTLATAEAQLHQAAQDLQRATAESSPATAQALQEAGQQMQRAQDNLTKRENAAPAQQAALDALQQAEQQLQTDLANAEQAEQAPAAAAAAALNQAQQQVGQALAQLAQASPTNPEASQPAGQALEKAANSVSELAANPHNGLSAAAQAPVQAAQQALTQAAAEVASHQSAAALADATAAQAALGQAQAALAKSASLPPPRSPSSGPPGPRSAGQSAGQSVGQPGPAAAAGGGHGSADSSSPSAPVAVKEVTGSSAYLGLPPRDRQAIQQSQGEKYPAEYGPLIEQYLRNLAEQSGRGSK